MHQGGKSAVRSPDYEINNISVLRKVYTPGVAQVSLLIKNIRPWPDASYQASGVLTDAAVLGLGDVGPLAAMPGHGRVGQP